MPIATGFAIIGLATHLHDQGRVIGKAKRPAQTNSRLQTADGGLDEVDDAIDEMLTMLKRVREIEKEHGLTERLKQTEELIDRCNAMKGRR